MQVPQALIGLKTLKTQFLKIFEKNLVTKNLKKLLMMMAVTQKRGRDIISDNGRDKRVLYPKPLQFLPDLKILLVCFIW